jgi:hypothetical protein
LNLNRLYLPPAQAQTRKASLDSVEALSLMQALGAAKLRTPDSGGEGASYSRMSLCSGLDWIGSHGSFLCVSTSSIRTINGSFLCTELSTARSCVPFDLAIKGFF